MEFKETYRHEVYLSRKDRARRALFAAKLTGIALAITIGATLRADPELRNMLFTAGMDGVATFANLQTPEVTVSALPPLNNDQPTQTKREAGDLPTSRVKINRPENGATGQTSLSEQLDQALAHVGQGN